ncbi:hypothetical protein Hanom_Chr14g01290191 [Helianthus anomalus]
MFIDKHFKSLTSNTGCDKSLSHLDFLNQGPSLFTVRGIRLGVHACLSQNLEGAANEPLN